MFHLAVVLEKTEVIDVGLHAQHAREFVIDLHADATHVMLDAAPLDTRGQSRTDFRCEFRCDLFTQEARDTLGAGRRTA